MKANPDLLKEIKEEIENIKAKKTYIIVEGKKDKNALQGLGVENVLMLTGSIYEFCEKIAKLHKEVILLTDLDAEGRKLYSKIKENLEKNHVRIIDDLRLILLKSEIRHIEGLNTYLNNLAESFEKK